ncbi:MAG: hypothetical protein WCJ86_02835 [Candidatus Saccharibacteria bacterium]
MNIKTVRTNIEIYWKDTIYWLAGLTTFVAILGYHISTLLTGATPKEIATVTSVRSLKTLSLDPTFIVYKAAQQFMNLFSANTVHNTRLISTAFAVVTMLLFYYVLRHWQGTKIAILGTIMLVTSSWFLTYARMATPDITYILLIVMSFAYVIWAKNSMHESRTIIAGGLLTVALIYTPGLIWFIVLPAIWQRKLISQLIFKSSKSAIAALTLTIILLLPLGYSIFSQPSIINTFLAFPTNLSALPMHFIQNIINIFRSLTFGYQKDATLGLINEPVIDIFTCAMFILGLFDCYTERGLDRTKMVIGFFVVSIVLVSLGGAVGNAILLPFIYLLASIGIGRMLGNWFIVFPRNPVARNIGLGLIIGIITLVGYYHITRYFVAWPNSPETISALKKFE